jgi:hypothetical protein
MGEYTKSRSLIEFSISENKTILPETSRRNQSTPSVSELAGSEQSKNIYGWSRWQGIRLKRSSGAARLGPTRELYLHNFLM